MNKVGIYSGIYGRLSAWAKSLFHDPNTNTFKQSTDPHKKKVRTIALGRRQFNFRGVDGKIHTARVGKPFKVRPAGLPHVFLATDGNRGFIEVKS